MANIRHFGGNLVSAAEVHKKGRTGPVRHSGRRTSGGNPLLHGDGRAPCRIRSSLGIRLTVAQNEYDLDFDIYGDNRLTTRLSQFVNFATYEASEKFFCELMIDSLACGTVISRSIRHMIGQLCLNDPRAVLQRTFFALVILVQLEPFERGSAGNQLMAELGLVLGVIIAASIPIDLLMCVLCFVYMKREQ